MASHRPADAPNPRLIDDNPTAALLEAEHASAERALNRVRLGVLMLLTVAAALYSVVLPRALSAVNAAVLLPMLLWTLSQHFGVHRQHTVWRHLSTATRSSTSRRSQRCCLGTGWPATPIWP